MWESIRGLLVDRDGVLTCSPGNVPLPGVLPWMKELQHHKTPFLIASNHTLSSPDEAVHDLNRVGFDVKLNQILTPLCVLMEYFKRRNPGNVFVIGTDLLKNYLKDNGIQLTQAYGAQTVLMGFCRDLTYQEMSDALTAVHINKADFIALHQNRLFMDRSGKLELGLGAWVKAIEYATGVQSLIVGKPNPFYYEIALNRIGLRADEAVMISDDPFGDLWGAKQIGIRTVFLTSGKYPDSMVLNQLTVDQKPDLVMSSIKDVPTLLV